MPVMFAPLSNLPAKEAELVVSRVATRAVVRGGSPCGEGSRGC